MSPQIQFPGRGSFNNFLYEAQLVSKPNRLLDHTVIKLNVALIRGNLLQLSPLIPKSKKEFDL